MSLFPIDSETNLLPYDGEAYYHDGFFDLKRSLRFKQIMNDSIDWQHDIVKIFGKTHVTSRKVAWYGDKPYNYKYSGKEKIALSWTPDLLEIKNQIEERTKTGYNSCLLNYYHHGEEGMGWHQDNESVLKRHAPIASISFGASRDFQFRHLASKTKVSIHLNDGSLLLMKGKIQDFWQHQLPKRKRVKNVRINLTFRTIKELT